VDGAPDGTPGSRFREAWNVGPMYINISDLDSTIITLRNG
jgi:hypothetical protein